MGLYFAKYFDKLHTSNGMLFLDGKMVVPPQLRAPITMRLHKGHSGMWKMQGVANNDFWWPHMSRQIHSSAAYCQKSIQSGKNLKSVIPQGDVVPLDVLGEPNQEIQLEFLGPLPAVWGLIS